MNGWIGVDLDGTFAQYEGWKGHLHIGEPILAMVNRIKDWLAQGKEVRIFTARVYCAPINTGRATLEELKRWSEAREAKQAIEAYCLLHIGVVLPVTCTKDYGMVELWDDRAVRVVANTGEPCCFQHRWKV